MKKLITLASILMISYSGVYGQISPEKYVNPFIGTSNYGTTQPGPILPSGMVSMSPFTTIGNDNHKIRVDRGWCSTPYVWENKHCAGFTNVNLSGVGCPDFGSILLMPTTGELKVDFREYNSIISDQKATAGYYSANIDKYKIKAEMTAAQRSTISRYVFPGGESNILLNIGLGLTNESGGSAKIVSDREVEGYKLMGTFCYTESQSIIPVYFVVRVSKPMNIKYWKKQNDLEGTRSEWDKHSGKYKIYERYFREMAGSDIGVAFSFIASKDEAVEVRVGVSFVSCDNARENLEKEIANSSFEDVKLAAEKSWNNTLSTVAVEGGDDNKKSIFYTSLYHAMIHPNTLQDVNGEYPAMVTGKTKKVKSGDRLTTFSLWDTYRINPALMALINPERQLNSIRSLMDMYRESGNLPKFEVFSQEFHVMQGDPAIPFMVDSYFKGLLKDIDAEEMYEAMRNNAFTEGAKNRVRPDNDFYSKNYYVPLTTDFDNSTSQALEYYIADWALAQMAKDLGKNDDYKILMERALGYKKYFDPEYSLLRPLLPNGEFMAGFDPKQGENFESVHGFHEGTSYNYSYFVAHDMKGLIKLHGGSKKFVTNLDKVFTDKLFDMSNEPDMSYPYYFSFVKGEEWRTQYYVDMLLDKHFKNTHGGLPGNDDSGTMSTWCALSMMGLYPPVPSEDQYVVLVPKFEKITITLDPKFYSQKELVIERIGNGKYIDKIVAGTKNLKGVFISHKQLTDCGTLKIYTTNKK